MSFQANEDTSKTRIFIFTQDDTELETVGKSGSALEGEMRCQEANATMQLGHIPFDMVFASNNHRCVDAADRIKEKIESLKETPVQKARAFLEHDFLPVVNEEAYKRNVLFEENHGIEESLKKAWDALVADCEFIDAKNVLLCLRSVVRLLKYLQTRPDYQVALIGSKPTMTKPITSAICVIDVTKRTEKHSQLSFDDGSEPVDEKPTAEPAKCIYAQ